MHSKMRVKRLVVGRKKRRGWIMHAEQNIRTQRQPEDFDQSQVLLAHPLERTTETEDVSENERPRRNSQQ